MVVAPPRLIGGRFRLDQEIGRGGMAVVYRAHDLQLERDVALKLIDVDPRSDPAAADTFIREARAAALPHPNIATVFDAGRHEGQPYLVMELIDGGDLASLLQVGGPLEPAEAARIAHGVARGLAALHARGLVHCDVKPQNILLNHRRQPKLVDFGIARLATATKTIHGGEILGSIPYLSPEQIRGDRIDARTDVYAVGIVLYELLAGQPPFTGNTLAEVAIQRLHKPPAPIRQLVPDTPPALAAVLDRALAIDPAKRFPDAGALAAGLASALEGGETGRQGDGAAGRQKDHVTALGIYLRRQALALFGLAATLRSRVAPSPRRLVAPSLMTFLQRPLWLATGLICFLLLGIGILRVATFGVAAEVPTSEVEPRAAVAADLAAPVLGPEAVPVLAPTTAPAVASAAAAPAAIPTVAVPAVGAMPFDEAARQLRGAGLEVQTTEEVTLDTPRGIVVSQEPPAGASVRPGEPVRLLVSTGIRVPDLRGQHWDDVNAWLDQHGWPLAKARFIVADRPVWGQVVGQSPLPDEGPVADKASASLSLEIAGPPEATRTGFPRASSAAESGASETEAETEPAAGAIPARALVQPGPAAQSAPAAPPQLVPAVAPAQAPPPAAPVQAPAAPPPAPRRAAPPPPPPPPPPAPRAEPARREPARAEVRKPDRRAEDEDRKRGGDRSAPGRREDDDDD